MQHQIAEFLAHIFVIFLEDGVGKLKCLFHRQIPQRIERLFAIPRALLAQLVHDFQKMSETGESVCVFVGLVHIYILTTPPGLSATPLKEGIGVLGY